jgi:pilus assembly protein CpaE
MIVVVDPDPGWRFQFREKLGREGLTEVEGLVELQHLLTGQASELAVAILGPGLDAHEALRAADSMQLVAPGMSVILLSSALTPDVLHEALRAGIKDVLPASSSAAQIQEAVTRAEGLAARQPRRSSPATESSSRASKVVTVFSCKGGCGKSVVASNIALLLGQMTGQQVVLVDLDLQSGDLAIMLGLLPAWTIYDAAEHLDRLDGQLLHGYLTPHRSKALLLAAPLEPSLADAVSPDAVRRIIRTLRETTPYVVVDGPASFTDQIIAALDESDVCVLVGSMDVPSIKNLKLGLQTLGRLGFARDRVKLVLTRSDSKVGLHLSEVEKTLGTSIDIAIPSSREVPLSVNQGVPLAAQGKKSAVTAALGRLAESLHLPAETAEARHRAPWTKDKSTKQRSDHGAV